MELPRISCNLTITITITITTTITMLLSSSPINIPLLVRGFTTVGILAAGAYQVPQILKACAQNQQQGHNPSMAQSSSNQHPPIPSHQGVPSLSLQDIELNTIWVIHITKPHQDSGPRLRSRRLRQCGKWGRLCRIDGRFWNRWQCGNGFSHGD